MSSIITHSVEIGGGNGRYEVFVQRATTTDGQKTVERVGTAIEIEDRKSGAMARYEGIKKEARFHKPEATDVIRGGLTKSVEAANESLKSWGERFAKEPMYALSWSREAFEKAAELEVAKELLARLGMGFTLATLKQVVFENVASKASGIAGKSSSSTSNVADDYILKAWAGAMKRLAEIESYTTEAAKNFEETCRVFGLDPADPAFSQERDWHPRFF